jgi:hypothetical protein
MANDTYVPLATTTVSSNSATVTLSLTGITGYTDLQILVNAKKGENTPNAQSDMWMQFNGDTGAHYSWTAGSGYSGGTLSYTRQTNQGNMYVDYYAELDYTYPSVRDISIFSFASTAVYKTVYVRTGKGTEGTDMIQGMWRGSTGTSKEAITSITFGVNSGTIAAGSTFTVYGIANTIDQGIKANGGIVYQDTTYWYHVFAASGTFTPLQSLSADVLCVAGGGGGSHGGGGAGGVTYYSSQSLTATNYTVTVGSGGSGGASNHSTRGTNGGNSQFASLTASVGGGTGGQGNTTVQTGVAGGSGGGGAPYSGGPYSGGSNTSGQGNIGGTSGASSVYYAGGGGGGAGAAGATGDSAVGGGAGGNGISTYSSWGVSTGIGEVIGSTYYIAGGGGGGSDNGWSVAGYGGGGQGATQVPLSGKANTGGGGGGSSNVQGGAGGSGVVIVRYAR